VDQRALTIAIIERLDLDLGCLWIAHVALGGHASERQLTAYCQGLGKLPPSDRNLISHVINESETKFRLGLIAPYTFSPLSAPNGPVATHPSTSTT
jgi:hypothetical protein